MVIKNNKDGTTVGVTKDNQLLVESSNQPLTHHNAIERGRTFSVCGIDEGITAGTQTVLHVLNTDPERVAVITSFEWEAITTTTSPNVGEFFSFGTATTVISGGTPATVFNTNSTSGNVSGLVATQADPLMTTPYIETYRKYKHENGNRFVENTEGAIVLGLNGSVEMRFTSLGTGVAVAFFVITMLDNR